MILFRLALKSLKNRRLSTFLTVVSISLSIILLLAVERTKRAAEDGFTQSISQVDLLVGAKTGPLNLILYTIFNMGNASNNISWESYQEILKMPEVAWTIPYSLGDGHHGFRVVGTDVNFYEHYRFRGDQRVEFSQGHSSQDLWDVVIGSEVASKLNYSISDKIVLSHGVTRGEGIQQHDDKPFHVVGILKSTGTVLDQSLYVTLEGIEALHVDWKKGGAPRDQDRIAPESLTQEKLNISSITSFFLRTKSRIETLRLQRALNEFEDEPLLAIIPGATLSELWRGLSQVDLVLKIISFMVLIVGMAAMVSTLLAGLNERRREMAILRSLGAGPKKIFSLLVFESFLLTTLAILAGVIVNYFFFFILAGWLESQFGFYLKSEMLTTSEFKYLLIIWIFGASVGFIPAYQATRWALKDGLSIRS